MVVPPVPVPVTQGAQLSPGGAWGAVGSEGYGGGAVGSEG